MCSITDKCHSCKTPNDPQLAIQVQHSINNELTDTLGVLDKAMVMHIAWVNRLCEYLICNQRLPENILKDDAHRLCDLGRWYYSHEDSLLNDFNEFQEIEAIHRDMHSYAQTIVYQHQSGQGVLTKDYRHFVSTQNTLFKLLSTLKEKLLYSAHSRDALTGAVRRDVFLHLAGKAHLSAEASKQAYSLAMIDVDQFKLINDQHGHVVGDHVLQAIANTIRANIRGTDILCRFGGDEFILLLQKAGLEQAAMVMNKIRILINALEIKSDAGTTVRPSLSVGVAEWKESLSIQDLITNADRKLYLAKQQGRNRVIT